MNNPLDFHVLIDDYVRGVITPEDSQKLLDLIKQDPDVLKNLRSNMMADFLLAEKYALDRKICSPEDQNLSADDSDLLKEKEDLDILLAELVQYEKNAIPIKKEDLTDYSALRRKNRKILIRKILISTAVLLFITIGTWVSLQTLREEWKPKGMPLFKGIAKIAEMIDPVWENTNIHYKEGQSLGPDNLFLKSGKIRIQFTNGVSIIMNGPANLSLSDSMHTFCKEGDLTVFVPPEGSGFELLTPFTKIIDRGTEFAVRVDSAAIDLKVLRGKVDLFQGNTLLDSLFEGKDFSFSKSPLLRPAKPIDPNKWITFSAFRSNYEQTVQIKKEKEVRRTFELDRNPNLLVRFDFNDQKNGSVANRSARSTGIASALVLTETQSDPGDLPGKQSVKMDQPSALARFKVEGQYNNLTLFARVKIHQLRNEANVFFVSEEFQKEDGGFLWQISQDGQINFLITDQNARGKRYYESIPCYFPELNGTWSDFALVLNGKEQKIEMYLDGKQVSSEIWSHPIPLKVGNAILGNLDRARCKKNDRFLGGSFAEFTLFDRAFTAVEIKQHYKGE
ncbi:MAG: LamG-like jellyroll fold domain-containing protein [Planctomycetia bacterium]|nr:LamG-like jellyroll fold domain-containing protein [Planctomycetia bacterium]